MAKDKALTPEQRRFAAEHHNLIYWFLNRNRLPDSEFYGITALGYLRAVVAYDEKPGLRERYKFSTIAYYKMNDALRSYNRTKYAQARRGEPVSLDEQAANGSSPASPDYGMMDFDERNLTHELIMKLSLGDRKILKMKLFGLTTREISHKQHITMKTVADRVKAIYPAALEVCKR
jgi:RNA polymerase sigma-70 factor (ECF subfamily)